MFTAIYSYDSKSSPYRKFQFSLTEDQHTRLKTASINLSRVELLKFCWVLLIDILQYFFGVLTSTMTLKMNCYWNQISCAFVLLIASMANIAAFQITPAFQSTSDRSYMRYQLQKCFQILWEENWLLSNILKASALII